LPPLALHISIARSVAERLHSDLLDGQRGSLYLGSTAPDIRVITRWERERTHFFDLENFNEQNGVPSFFEEYPALAEVGSLEPTTATFVAGYTTHLVMDETWIQTVYRPYFGRESQLGGGLRANIMDRAIQFSLDRERRGDKDLVLHVVEEVTRCDLSLDVGFIDYDTLRQWHGVVLDMIGTEPDWERFQRMAKRHLKDGEAESDEFEDLVRAVPDLVDETVRYLSPELIDTFMETALERSLATVKEYLRCA
jgi:hypothetical protein